MNQYGYRPHGLVTRDGAVIRIAPFTWWRVVTWFTTQDPHAVADPIAALDHAVWHPTTVIFAEGMN